jgi:hypothetical protein
LKVIPERNNFQDCNPTTFSPKYLKDFFKEVFQNFVTLYPHETNVVKAIMHDLLVKEIYFSDLLHERKFYLFNNKLRMKKSVLISLLISYVKDKRFSIKMRL